MKKIHCTFIIVLFLATIAFADNGTTPQVPRKDWIIGTWNGKDGKGSTGSFIFKKDGGADMIVDGKPASKELAEAGAILVYTFNPDVVPAALDITMKDKNGKIMGTLYFIADFLSRDRIRLRSFFTEIRPSDFSKGDTDDTIILDKEKENAD